MHKKICLSGLILCFMLMTFTAQAQSYDSGHDFFNANYWKHARASDVKKKLIKGADINEMYRWVSSVELTHLQGMNVLAFAVHWGARPQAIEVLIKNGATITGDALQYAKNLEMLQFLVKRGGNVNGLSRDNSTPLHNAWDMTAPMMEFLLQKGAVPNVRNKYGNTALSLLYDRGNSENKDWQVKVALLKKAGAKLGEGKTPQEAGIVKYTVKKNTENTYTPKHNFYNPYFWRAATVKDVKRSKIKDISFPYVPQDVLGNNFLTLALTYSTDTAVINFLIKDGLVSLEKDELCAAAQNENPEILRMYLERVPPYFYEEDYKENIALATAAKYAARAGLKDNVAMLIKLDPSIRYTDFAEGKFLELSEVRPSEGRPDKAALVAQIQSMPMEYGPEHPFFSLWGFQMREKGIPNLQEYLIEGATLDSTYRWAEGIEMQHYNGHTILEMALMRNVPAEVIDFLIKNGATITNTAINLAEDVATFKTLVKYGADVNTVSANDTTPLFTAAVNSTELLEFLLQHGALPNIKNKEGETALTLLYVPGLSIVGNDAEVQKRIQILEAAGAKIGAGISPLDAGLIKYTVQKNTEKSYNDKHNYNNVDFWRVATLKDVKQSFIKGENLNSDAYKGKSLILIRAINQTNNPAIVEFLIKNGAKIGESAMIAAASNKNSAILKILIQSGGDVNAHSGFYFPLSAAAEAGHKDNVALLLAHGADVNKADFEFGNALCMAPVTEGRPDRAPIMKMLKAAGGKVICGGDEGY